MSIWKVKTDGLNLRAEPRVADGNILGSLPLTQTVSVLSGGQGQKWWEVETVLQGNTLRGFVNSEYLRWPVGGQVETLIANAVKEWLRFKRGDGQEDLAPYYRYVGEYWQALGLNLDGRDRDQPWSAAFISYIVRRSGYGAAFPYAAGHSRYIDDAIKKRQANQSAAFWGYRLSEHTPQLGDLICKWRETPVTFDSRPSGGYKSHCDVIVEIRDNQVRGIGGNVNQSVSMSTFPLENGLIKATGNVFAILKNKTEDNATVPAAAPAAGGVSVSAASLSGYGLELQKARDSGWLPMFEAAARTHGLSLAYVLAIASRETNMRNMLGDAGHGVGLMQIDIRFHPIARQAKQSGSWATDPAPLIDYGASLVAGNLAWAKEQWPSLGSATNPRSWLKIAASAYNAGRGGARHGVVQGDSDRYTTGHDYGRDVVARMNAFADLLAA